MRINPPCTPISLSQKQADKLISTIKANDLLSKADQTLLYQIIRMFLWLQYSLRETRISLSKIKKLVFGQKSEKRKKNSANSTDESGHDETLPEDKSDLEPDDSTMNNGSSSESTETESPSKLPSIINGKINAKSMGSDSIDLF